MKEHPDYKYRPRRKPKPLLASKSPAQNDRQSGGSTNTGGGGGGGNNLGGNNNNPNHLNHNHHHLLTSSGEYLNLHANGASQAAAAAAKYPFVGPPLDQLALGLPGRHPAAFPHIPHYGTLDPAFAIDLHTRIQAMCGGLYHPWRYFGCPPAAAMQQLQHNNSQSESPPPMGRHSPRSVSPSSGGIQVHCESPTNLKVGHPHSPIQPSDLSLHSSRLKHSPPTPPPPIANII